MKTLSIHQCLRQEVDDFRELGDVKETDHGPLIYADRGAKVLAVAHLDYVRKRLDYKVKKRSIKKCPQLDDRLGVFILLTTLPRMGIKEFDVLLCDSEETGNSTAQYFETDKEYNWIFEFDRAGSDVVMYRYRNQESEHRLEECGFTVGFGSFTDICYLQDLRAKGFNFGTGYHGQHTDKCYADLRESQKSVTRFTKFWEKYKDVRMEHEPVQCYRSSTKGKPYYDGIGYSYSYTGGNYKPYSGKPYEPQQQSPLYSPNGYNGGKLGERRVWKNPQQFVAEKGTGIVQVSTPETKRIGFVPPRQRSDVDVNQSAYRTCLVCQEAFRVFPMYEWQLCVTCELKYRDSLPEALRANAPWEDSVFNPVNEIEETVQIEQCGFCHEFTDIAELDQNGACSNCGKWFAKVEMMA